MTDGELEPHSSAFLTALREAEPLDWSPKNIGANRAAIKRAQIGGYRRRDGSQKIRSVRIDSPHGDLKLEIQSGTLGVVALFVHGGGWVAGDLESYGWFIDRLATTSGATVVGVEYTRAPEARFPAALEECFTALTWCVETFSLPVSVVGDSAGGNLAAALSLLARDRGVPVASQILICPVLDPGNDDYPSRRKYGNGDYLLSNRELAQMIDCYAAAPADVADPLFSPARAKDLGGVAPATIIAAEFDMLRDEGEHYAALLRAEGVPAQCETYPGTIHSFPVFGDAIPIGQQAIERIADCLRAQAYRSHTA